MNQTTNTILMVRPNGFRMNEQTAVNNFFQEDLNLKNVEINKRAQQEFDEFVHKLKRVGVKVIVIKDDPTIDRPDAVFPNNWVSFHANGNMALYPMFAENRRAERREDIIEILEGEGFNVKHVIDYTAAEAEEVFLEGTGSLILDRSNRKAYCALSPRANEDLLIEFCEDFEFSPVIFTANQTVGGKRMPIYHTNVMMCIAEEFAVICLETIDDTKEKKHVIKQLKQDNKEIIPITEDQMHHFAGNMLQVRGTDDKTYLVMSKSAYDSLNSHQIKAIEKYSTLLSADLETIETCGGGSARCMMAEVFLPKSE